MAYRGLACLRDLTHLEALDLSYTTITDAGLESLRGMHGLRRLNLGFTKVGAPVACNWGGCQSCRNWA